MRTEILALALVGCGGSSAAELRIDLRTDYAPGVEFDGVRVEVEQDETLRDDALVDPTADYSAGVRIAEFDGLRAGPMRVVVSLVLDGVVRIRHPIALSHPGGAFGMVALVTRNCEGVACTDPGATQCLDGRCVDERCTPTSPEFCPPATCSDATGCSSSLSCAAADCIGGVCVELLDDAQCDEGELCRRGIGCVPSDGGTCAASLDCALFESTCLAGLGRRCAAVGVSARYEAVIYDPDSGSACPATTLTEFGGSSGNPLLFRESIVTASACDLVTISLDTGSNVRTAAPCGLPTLLTEDSLAWIESVDEMGQRIIHLPGGVDMSFSVSDPTGRALWGIAPGEAAVPQTGGRWQLVDIGTATLGAVLTEPASPLGIARDPASGGFLWVTGEANMLEVIHTDADNVETQRVTIATLPPLDDIDANYVGAGCTL